MAPKPDIVDELQRAANTIFDVDPVERQRLLVSGARTLSTLRQVVLAGGYPDAEEPDFVNDLPAIAEMAAKPDAVEVLVAAGMSLLATEIERLRGVADRLAPEKLRPHPTFAEALAQAEFKPFLGDRRIIRQGRVRGSLKGRNYSSD